MSGFQARADVSLHGVRCCPCCRSTTGEWLRFRRTWLTCPRTLTPPRRKHGRCVVCRSSQQSYAYWVICTVISVLLPQNQHKGFVMQRLLIQWANLRPSMLVYICPACRGGALQLLYRSVCYRIPHTLWILPCSWVLSRSVLKLCSRPVRC